MSKHYKNYIKRLYIVNVDTECSSDKTGLVYNMRKHIGVSVFLFAAMIIRRTSFGTVQVLIELQRSYANSPS